MSTLLGSGRAGAEWYPNPNDFQADYGPALVAEERKSAAVKLAGLLAKAAGDDGLDYKLPLSERVLVLLSGLPEEVMSGIYVYVDDKAGRVHMDSGDWADSQVSKAVQALIRVAFTSGSNRPEVKEGDPDQNPHHKFTWRNEGGTPDWPCVYPPKSKEAKVTSDALDAAGRRVHAEPSLPQIEAGNYRKGHLYWQGLGISLEHAKGGVRKGVGKDGQPWESVLKDAYGYFKRTEGNDGDHVDVFVCDENPRSELVFVVNQVNPDSGRLDEHKCIIGCNHEAQARRVYLRNYAEGWRGLGSVTPMTVPDFKLWLRKGDMGKAAAEEQAGKPFVIACDFDGTLAAAISPFDPDRCGGPQHHVIHWVREFKKAGAKIIVWTCRHRHGPVKAWLDEHDVPYDHVNENPDGPPGDSPKIYADVYIDDRGLSTRELPAYGRTVLAQIYERAGKAPPKLWRHDADWSLKNEDARVEAQGSHLPHVRDGVLRCRFCDAKYHAETPDDRCPDCGLDAGGVKARGKR